MIQTFIILIVISFMFFLYFKVKQWRTSAPVEKKWQQMKSSIALGSFVLFFGLNLAVLPRSKVDLIIGIIFVLVGGANAYFGYRGYKHLLPFVIEEAEQSRP